MLKFWFHFGVGYKTDHKLLEIEVSNAKETPSNFVLYHCTPYRQGCYST